MKRKEEEDQKQTLGPGSKEISDQSSQSHSGDNGLECLGGDSPARGAERLQVASKGSPGGAHSASTNCRLVLHFGGGRFLAFYNCQIS